jgi:drug/metabolite transporter (DMT)-like permease
VQRDLRSPLLGSLTVALAATLFGMLGVLSRNAYDLGLAPFAFVTWRAGVGALGIGVFIAWSFRHGARLVGWRSLDGRGRASLGVAALMGAALNMAMFLAFARIPVAIVLLCFYLYPALVAAASAVLRWEPFDRPRVVALVVALGGMIAVVVGGPTAATAGGLDPVGVALALSAAVCQAVFVLVSRRGYRTVPTNQAMGTLLAIAALIAGGLAIAIDGPESLVAPFSDGRLLGLLVFTGVFAAAIPSFLFLAGIRRIGPVRAGILMLLEPLVGVALAAAFLAEDVGPVQAVGGVAILAAAVILQRAQPAESAVIPAGEPEPAPAAVSGVVST